MTADRLDYIRAIIRHRVPEVTDADLAVVAEQPDTLPVEIANQVLEVVEALEAKLEALVERYSLPPETLVEALRLALVDLDVDAKAQVVAELNGWVEAERGSGELLQ